LDWARSIALVGDNIKKSTKQVVRSWSETRQQQQQQQQRQQQQQQQHNNNNTTTTTSKSNETQYSGSITCKSII